jgi:hypothetical protein
MIQEIKLRSKMKGDAALDNVARFLKRTENTMVPGSEKIGNHETHESGAMTLAIDDQSGDQLTCVTPGHYCSSATESVEIGAWCHFAEKQREKRDVSRF